MFLITDCDNSKYSMMKTEQVKSQTCWLICSRSVYKILYNIIAAGFLAMDTDEHGFLMTRANTVPLSLWPLVFSFVLFISTL